MLGLRFCARAFSSCGERGPLFIEVRRPLTIAASLVAEHRLQTRRLSSCGSRAQLLRGMWDLPRPGLEPVYPALAGRFSTTAPPGKPRKDIFKKRWNQWNWEQGKKIEKINKTKSWFFDKINVIVRTLVRLTKQRKEDTNIRDQKKNTATDPTGVKR